MFEKLYGACANIYPSCLQKAHSDTLQYPVAWHQSQMDSILKKIHWVLLVDNLNNAILKEVVRCYLDGVSMCLIHQEVLFAPR